MNKKSLTDFNKISITYFPIFKQATQYLPAIILLCQIIFRCYRNSKNNKNIWFYKKIDDWCDELKINLHVFMVARALLVKLGFIEYVRGRKRRPTWYRINVLAITEYLNQRDYKIESPTIQNIFNALSSDKNKLFISAEILNITHELLPALYYAELSATAQNNLLSTPSSIPRWFKQSPKQIKYKTGLSEKQQALCRIKLNSLPPMRMKRVDGDKNIYFLIESCFSSFSQLEYIDHSDSIQVKNTAHIKNNYAENTAHIKNNYAENTAHIKNNYAENTAHIPLLHIETKEHIENRTHIVTNYMRAGSTPSIQPAGQQASYFNITGSPAIKFDNPANSEKHVNQENEQTGQQASYFNITGSPAIEFYDQANDLNFSESLTEQQTESESDYLTGSPTGRHSPEFDNPDNSSNDVNQGSRLEDDYNKQLARDAAKQQQIDNCLSGTTPVKLPTLTTGRPLPEFGSGVDIDLDITGSRRITKRPTPPPSDNPLFDLDDTGTKKISPPVEQPVVDNGSGSAQEQPIEQPVIDSGSPPAQEQSIEQPVVDSGSDSPNRQPDALLDHPLSPLFWVNLITPALMIAPLISPLISHFMKGSGSQDQDQSKNSGSPPP